MGSPIAIEVKVAGRGSVRAGQKTVDTRMRAICDLCGSSCDVVVSIGGGPGSSFACKSCLRSRLEAITVAAWELREGNDTGGLPWGKVSG